MRTAIGPQRGRSKKMRARGQRKDKLMKCAEQVIDELLKWDEETERPTLSQIEEKVLELRERFGEELAGEVVEGQEAKQPVPGPACPECGQEMSYKGQKQVRPHTWVGEVQIERGYYHCQGCKVGLFPPG
jgi:DNA repair exonuclease SbcCD ATPase subunit